MTLNPTKRKMPTVREIYLHWAERFQTPDETYCMACREESPRIDRAHILARFDGGEDTVENLILLCFACHKHQEYLSSVLAATNRPADGENLESLLQIVSNDALMMYFRRLNGGTLSPKVRADREFELLDGMEGAS